MRSRLIGYLRVLVAFSALNHTIEDQHIAVCFGFEDEYVLVSRALDMKYPYNFESHGLPWPVRIDFKEPAV